MTIKLDMRKLLGYFDAGDAFATIGSKVGLKDLAASKIRPQAAKEYLKVGSKVGSKPAQ